MAATSEPGDGPVAAFCRRLRKLQEGSPLDRKALVQKLSEMKADTVGRSQLHRILNGEIERPPDWDTAVEPIVTACTDGRAGIVDDWRGQYFRLLGAYGEYKRRGDGRQAPALSPLVEQSSDSRRARQTLPADTAAFTGRRVQLEQIKRAAEQAGKRHPATVICAIDGMPGVGKTALAVHAAHLLARDFPDGQMLVGLASDSDGPPSSRTLDGLASLLTSFGFPPESIPKELGERATCWREATAGKKLLLVLDDAADTDQVVPLLPGSANCLVLVTSRKPLRGLRSQYGARPISLDALTEREAVTLFHRVARRRPVDPADREATLGVVQECGRLPLAIGILAASLDASASVRQLLRALNMAQNRLSVIDDRLGDVRKGVVAAFDLSYWELSPEEQQMLRLLSAAPGPDIDVQAATALADLPRAEADATLRRLAEERRLVERTRPDRYRLHALIAAYGQTQCPEAEREPAIQRIYDYYLRTAEAANHYLAGYPQPHPHLASGSGADPRIRNRVQAQRWISGERDNLLACIDQAAADHRDSAMVALTAAVSPDLQSTGPWATAIQLQVAAAAAAARLGDRAAQADALFELGVARYLMEDHKGARTTLAEARDLYRQTGSLLGEANCVYQQGVVQKVTRDEDGANTTLQQALGMYQQAGSELGQANTFSQLGAVHYLADDYADAGPALQQAVEIYRRIGYESGEATALIYLGAVGQETDDYPAAAQALRRARRICRAIDNPLGEANVLNQLGMLQLVTGEYAEATANLQQALSTYGRMGIRISAANALNRLGAVYTATGDLAGASAALDQALASYRGLKNRLGEADVLSDLGLMLIHAGDLLAATSALREALGIFQADAIPLGEAETLNRLGMLHRASDRNEAARPYHQQALRVARYIPSLLEQARALEGLGQCAASERERNEAAQQARQIYQQIGAAKAVFPAPEDGQS